MVSESGYPPDYEIFEGNAFGGHTMLPVIEAFKEKYKPERLVTIADAGFTSNKNIKRVAEKNYQVIMLRVKFIRSPKGSLRKRNLSSERQ